MEEEYFDPMQSLRQIEAMISKARNKLSENGHLYLVWGWVVFFCAAFQFLSQYFGWFQQSYWIWMACIIVFIYQSIYMAKKGRKRVVKTYTDNVVGAVWLTFLIMGGLVSFILVKGGHYTAIYSMILMLYGMPTMLSGVILKIPSLRMGGGICFLLSIASVWIPVQFHLPLLAVAVICAWIIPGYIMQHVYKVQQSKIS